MTYAEACEAILSQDQARREIERHDCDGGFAAFLAEVGDKPEYLGAEILDWLGY